MNIKSGDKVIFSQDYLNQIKPEFSDRYYDMISKTLEFKELYPSDPSFCIVIAGRVSLVAPTSSILPFQRLPV